MTKADARLVRRGIDPRLYHCWAAMKARCNNPRHQAYAWYGARGIKVCERWNIFENFAADMGSHPGMGWTLEREDNDKDYCRSNCVWATRTTQSRNTRGCKLSPILAAEIRGVYLQGGVTQRVLSARYGVAQATISLVVTDKYWKV